VPLSSAHRIMGNHGKCLYGEKVCRYNKAGKEGEIRIKNDFLIPFYTN
jgi:hypothetical protein